MIEHIDYEKLRTDLVNCYGIASIYNPIAIKDLLVVENADNESLILIALQNGFNLDLYFENKILKL